MKSRHAVLAALLMLIAATSALAGDATTCGGWKRGPLPAQTFGWGGVTEVGVPSDAGFWFAAFKGDHVLVVQNHGIVRFEAHEVGMYCNDLSFPPSEKKTSSTGPLDIRRCCNCCGVDNPTCNCDASCTCCAERGILSGDSIPPTDIDESDRPRIQATPAALRRRARSSGCSNCSPRSSCGPCNQSAPSVATPILSDAPISIAQYIAEDDWTYRRVGDQWQVFTEQGWQLWAGSPVYEWRCMGTHCEQVRVR